MILLQERGEPAPIPRGRWVHGEGHQEATCTRTSAPAGCRGVRASRPQSPVPSVALPSSWEGSSPPALAKLHSLSLLIEIVKLCRSAHLKFSRADHCTHTGWGIQSCSPNWILCIKKKTHTHTENISVKSTKQKRRRALRCTRPRSSARLEAGGWAWWTAPGLRRVYLVVHLWHAWQVFSDAWIPRYFSRQTQVTPGAFLLPT